MLPQGRAMTIPLVKLRLKALFMHREMPLLSLTQIKILQENILAGFFIKISNEHQIEIVRWRSICVNNPLALEPPLNLVTLCRIIVST
jgi:hypothetical protein